MSAGMYEYGTPLPSWNAPSVLYKSVLRNMSWFMFYTLLLLTSHLFTLCPSVYGKWNGMHRCILLYHNLFLMYLIAYVNVENEVIFFFFCLIVNNLKASRQLFGSKRERNLCVEAVEMDVFIETRFICWYSLTRTQQ